MNVYLWNNRILKEKDVDRYLNRIAHEKRNNIIKYALISVVGVGMLVALLVLGANKQKQQPINPVTTTAYKNASQNTK